MYRPNDASIDALVAQHPFALVVSGAEASAVTPLPMLLERHPTGTRLIGHFGRGNPQVALLRANPNALFVFQGPHGYVSPSWLADRTQAPTWNFATVHVCAHVEFLENPDSASNAVARLTAHMEAGRSNAWALDELGMRHDRLLGGIIAFRAEVVSINAKFKLGQNERPDVLTDILDGLEKTGQDLLRSAMIKANYARLKLDPKTLALVATTGV